MRTLHSFNPPEPQATTKVRYLGPAPRWDPPALDRGLTPEEVYAAFRRFQLPTPPDIIVHPDRYQATLEYLRELTRDT